MLLIQFLKHIVQIRKLFSMSCIFFAPFDSLGGSRYRSIFEQQYLESKRYLTSTFLKEYTISFLMVPRLIDFAFFDSPVIDFQLFIDFLFFTENLTLSFSVTHLAGHNIDLPSNCNIIKMVRVNITITRTFFKNI